MVRDGSVPGAASNKSCTHRECRPGSSSTSHSGLGQREPAHSPNQSSSGSSTEWWPCSSTIQGLLGSCRVSVKPQVRTNVCSHRRQVESSLLARETYCSYRLSRMELTADWANKSVTATGQSLVAIRVPILGLDEIDESDHLQLNGRSGLVDIPRAPSGDRLWTSLTRSTGARRTRGHPRPVRELTKAQALFGLPSTINCPGSRAKRRTPQRSRDAANELLLVGAGASA